MIVRSLTFAAMSLLSAWPCAAQSVEDDANIRALMREIGIKYLIADDRSLPKRDRAAWEASLAPLVDFDSLAESMRVRIRLALSTAEQGDKGLSDGAAIADKAVLFLLPRELSDYTIAYLRNRENGAALGPCSANPRPAQAQEFVMCLEAASENQRRLRFIAADGDSGTSLVFSIGERWRLAAMEGPISERTLMLIGLWK